MALPGYLEETAKDYATQAAAAYKTPLQPSTFMGQQFVAGEDPLQTKAVDMATAGLESYKPYLTAAQGDLTTAGGDVGAARTTAGGLGALTGASAYQPFMSFKWSGSTSTDVTTRFWSGTKRSSTSFSKSTSYWSWSTRIRTSSNGTRLSTTGSF